MAQVSACLHDHLYFSKADKLHQMCTVLAQIVMATPGATAWT